MRRAIVSVALAFAVIAGAGACGDDAPPVVTPKRVDPKLAPAEVAGGIALHENKDKTTRHALANPGDGALMADGRIWELRRADRLVGTLQISTVLPRFDLRRSDIREGMVSQILPASPTRIRIDGIEIFATRSDDRAQFLWFGADTYEVLQLKDKELDFETVVRDVIAHQRKIPAWKPLTDLIGEEQA